jgi:hypothetical protein
MRFAPIGRKGIVAPDFNAQASCGSPRARTAGVSTSGCRGANRLFPPTLNQLINCDDDSSRARQTK